MLLDHLAVAGETLEAAVAHVEETLGVKMASGGQHAHFGTHNQLLGLADGLYLEAISIDPAVDDLGYARWFDLDRFCGAPRLGNWICRSEDLVGELAQLDVEAGQPVSLQRGDLSWRMAVPENGVLPFDDLFPALMQWDVAKTPAELLPASGCRLRQLIVRHPQAQALAATIALDDDRVKIEQGRAELAAVLDTPHGERVLT